MSEEFLVSVITPVYNAAEFVTRAVESALAQPETGEVLLIEDNSPDDSLRVCRELAAKYEKVRLFRHPDGGNHGAGASRNLGMKNARFDYIAFLDADDFFLPDRFLVAKKVFQENQNCEGVYEAAGMHIQDEDAHTRWISSGKSNRQIQTIQHGIPPDKLSIALLHSGKFGYFLLDSLLIKKDILMRSGYMNETLRLHQDTDFIWRIAYVSNLFPGSIDDPVVMWGVHNKNRSSANKSLYREYKNRMAFWLSLNTWSKENATTLIQKEIRNRIIDFVRGHKYFKKFPRHLFPTKLIWFTRLLRLFLYPKLLFEIIVNK